MRVGREHMVRARPSRANRLRSCTETEVLDLHVGDLLHRHRHRFVSCFIGRLRARLRRLLLHWSTPVVSLPGRRRRRQHPSATATGTTSGASRTSRPTASSPRSSPEHRPAVLPEQALLARPPSPDDFELRWAGLRAHNRWLADWCGAYPERRAGIGQIFLNDVDDAIAEVAWIQEHGLRGGVLIPGVPPDDTHQPPYYSDQYDPLWAVCEELGVRRSTATRAAANPTTASTRARRSSGSSRSPLFAHRAARAACS